MSLVGRHCSHRIFFDSVTYCETGPRGGGGGGVEKEGLAALNKEKCGSPVRLVIFIWYEI